MENPVKCPVCHVEVRPTDYFCFNCGKNLKPKPPDTSLTKQIVVYLESILLPPYGIIIGLRYLREKDNKSKIVGWAAIILTIISILYFTKVTLDLINNVNSGLSNQMQQFEGF